MSGRVYLTDSDIRLLLEGFYLLETDMSFHTLEEENGQIENIKRKLYLKLSTEPIE